MATNVRRIWDYLKSRGLNDFGAAGLLGNIYAESGANPGNLQNTFNEKLHMSDEEYTRAVDDGSYQNFVHDGAGYGLCQWTYSGRKAELLSHARSAGVSIGDLDMQLDFLWGELCGGYCGVLDVLRCAASIREASDEVLFRFERPADQSERIQVMRTAYGQRFYDEFALSRIEGADNESAGGGLSNSPLVGYTKISPNRTSPRQHKIDTITIHCVVGQCTVEGLGEVFASTGRQASSNYGIGADGRIGMYVPEADRSWCSGGVDKNGNPIRVNGISGSDNDHRAITIEVASDTRYPYAVTDAAYEGLLRLLVDICRRNPGIGRLKWLGDKSLVGQVDKQNMTVHRWFANKSCPGDYLYKRHSAIAEEVNRRLDAEILKTEDENMDAKRFKELWLEMRRELQDNDAGEWSEAARAWAVESGLIVGGGTEINGEPNYMWADSLSREQLITVLYRFARMIGKA